MKTRAAARLFLFLVLSALANTACRRAADPLPGFPRLVLWAWERPENLSYIIPTATGVAYLAATITIGAGTFQRHPRMQPLLLPPRTPLIAVIRIESRDSNRPPPSAVVDEIVRTTASLPIRAVQIDFDARASERQYYQNLMADLRRKLPRSVALEMTALVSWCEEDDWIRNLPVIAAVPMFFRMGVDPHSTREHLRDPLCRSSIGISTDEFYVTIPSIRRVFVFSGQLWSESRYRAVLQASRKWFSNW